MNIKKFKRNFVLGVLFLLPVTFLLFLYPAKHNYNTLDIINENVADIQMFDSDRDEEVLLKDHITILGFLGSNPESNIVDASNLNELIYGKFKGFKKFQTVIVLPHSAKSSAKRLRQELSRYDELKYWHFVFGSNHDIASLHKSLKVSEKLKKDWSTNHVFIIDKDLNLRGRIDDRTDNEVEKQKPIYSKSSYNCSEVADLKNKMSEDMRILFTEYRQKRKGNFDSTTRRANDLKQNDEQN